MTHADAFLQAILDAPDDDAPRLLYADWLDEQGDAERAEFIRVQVALERRGHGVRGFRGREQDLLALHGAAWAAPVAGIAKEWTFRRGFIEEALVDALTLAERADDLFHCAPLSCLQLAGDLSTPQRLLLPARLAYCRHFARLRDLDLSRCRFLHDHGLAALLCSPHLTNLTSIRLGGCSVGDAGVRALVRWPHLGRLTRLDLCGNGISAAGVRALALELERRVTGGDGPRLRHLTLDDNPFGQAGRRAVLASPILRRAIRYSCPQETRTALGKK